MKCAYLLWLLFVITVVYKELTLHKEGECISDLPENASVKDRLSCLKDIAIFPKDEVVWKQFFISSFIGTSILYYLVYRQTPTLEFSIIGTFVLTVTQLLMFNFKSFHGWRREHCNRAIELFGDLSRAM